MSRRRFPFGLCNAICEEILPRDNEKEDEEEFFKFIRQNQSDVLLVLDGLDELPEDRWSEVDEIIQGRRTIFCQCPLVVTAARHQAEIRVRKSCNTLLEIVGFTTSVAFYLCARFFIIKENAAKALKLTREGDSFPKFEVLLSLRCRFPFNLRNARFCLEILKEKTNRNSLPLSKKKKHKNKKTKKNQSDVLLVLDGLDELPKVDGQR